MTGLRSTHRIPGGVAVLETREARLRTRIDTLTDQLEQARAELDEERRRREFGLRGIRHSRNLWRTRARAAEAVLALGTVRLVEEFTQAEIEQVSAEMHPSVAVMLRERYQAMPRREQ